MVNNLPTNTGDVGSIPRSGRSLVEGNGNPLQYFCLGNPMDRGAWWAPVHGGRKELGMTKRLTLSLSDCYILILYYVDNPCSFIIMKYEAPFFWWLRW